MTKLPYDENLDIRTFSTILDDVQNSYKFYWFYGILEEVKQEKRTISFKTIVFRMIAKSWYSIIEFRLHLGSMDKLNKIVLYVYNTYEVKKDVQEDKLLDFLKSLDDKEFDKMCSLFYKYVPYRLLSPFYEEIIGVPDHKKNPQIKLLSSKSNKGIYYFIDKSISMHEDWFNYILKNQNIMEGWLLFKLISFLQTRNPNTPSIMFKISAPQKRDLSKATKFWKKIIKHNPITDIYSGNLLTVDSEISIDHFIPWSFVLHDDIWNLIPTTKSINSGKSDNLPDLDKYLDSFCNQLFASFQLALTNKSFSKKELEGYLNLNGIELKEDLERDYFINILKETITPLHQLAFNQGFKKWQSKGPDFI